MSETWHSHFDFAFTFKNLKLAPLAMKSFVLVCVLVLILVLLLFPHDVVSLPYSPRGPPRKVYRGHGPIHQDTPQIDPYDQSSGARVYTEHRDSLRETRSIVHSFTSSTKRKILVSAVSGDICNYFYHIKVSVYWKNLS